MTRAWRVSPLGLSWLPPGVPRAEAEQPGNAIADRPMLIMVGLTGSGKTTTVGRLTDLLSVAAVLPDRRELTDAIIIPTITGSRDPVHDRRARFEATAAFRDRHPGGMAEILAGLRCHVPLPEGLLVFDGLRGTAEITCAVEHLPRADFAAMRVGPATRLLRLCGRADSFDRMALGDLSTDRLSVSGDGRMEIRAILTERGLASLAPEEEVERLVDRLSAGRVPLDIVARNAAIVAEESRYYDLDDTLAALDQLARDRTIVVDAENKSPEAVAKTIARYEKHNEI